MSEQDPNLCGLQYDCERSRELLRLGCKNNSADFREGQEEAIRRLVEGRGRLLVVQRTGWGKSFVYFVATKLLRERGHGPALLVSPLLALMRNQIAAAERMGVTAATINSDNQNDWAEIETRLERNEIDILLISPERLANERFRMEVLAGIATRISLLVIDEAHCMSDWGHDFRPHYRLLGRIVETLSPSMRLIATTATANRRVMDDLRELLGAGIHVLRGELCRPSLTLQTMRLPGQAERLAWMAEQLALLPGSGIIYTLTRRDATTVAEWLQTKGVDAEAYTSDTGESRESLEQALLDNRLKVLVATTALGMGFDKPDLAFVIHYQTPGSVIAYYQQVGRAGRALESAYGVLLAGDEDPDITAWFIASAFPSREDVNDVLGALEDAPAGLTMGQLLGALNLSRGIIEKTLDLLSLESPAPIAKQDGKWQLTPVQLSEEFWRRSDRLTSLRIAEQRQMQQYVDVPFGGHMPFLIEALDGDPSDVSFPTLPPLSTQANPRLVEEATVFLKRSSLPIEPREKWPSGGLTDYGLRGSIPTNLRAETGRALCSYGDTGWGSLVREGKYGDGRFGESLVTACVQMVRQWRPQPEPIWVTCVPSLRHPNLVSDFSRRLAASLGLPFFPTLEKTDARPEQKTMANSIRQARNVDGSISIREDTVHDGPVLLVDDLVDSRWTMTICAWLLREHGSGRVWPIALARAGGGT